MADFEVLSSEAGKRLFQPSSSREWLDDSDLKLLKKAVKAEEKTIVLHGTKFYITYGYRRTYPVSKETVDSVRLNPVDGSFVPMAYVPIKKIMAA